MRRAAESEIGSAVGREQVGRRPGWGSLAKTALVVAGGGLVAWSAGLHLYLWFRGYRTIPTVGVLFLIQAAVGILGAPVMVWWRRPLGAAMGAGYLASTAAGLLVSVRFGTFGFRESLAGPYVGLSLWVEGVGAGVLAVAVLAGAAARR